MKTIILLIALLPFSNVDTDRLHTGRYIVEHPTPAAINVQFVEATSYDEKGNTLNEKQRLEKALALLKEAFPDWTTSYKVGDWDCSTMSDFLQYYLTTCGIDSALHRGTASNGTSHAWVISGNYSIEAISLTVLTPRQETLYDKVYWRDNRPAVDSDLQGWWNTEYMTRKYREAYYKGWVQ